VDNDEVEQVLPQYVKTILSTKNSEEQAFATKVVYQTKREHKIEHNTPPIMMTSIEV
jgi:hypothetical protein